MPRKIALKRLSASDLTFFKWHFDNQTGDIRQKSINLNARVFIDQLYPALPQTPQGLAGWLSIDVLIFGPGLAEPLQIQRKIVKGPAYKNWRLNGEIVPDDMQRFEPLAVNDFVLLEFIGEIVPTQVRALFVAAAVPDDAPLFAEFDRALPIGHRAMRTLTAEELGELIRTAANLAVGHAADEFTLDEALEDAALGGQEGISRLRRRRARRSITLEDLRRARVLAELNGERGEQFVNRYFEAEAGSGAITAFTWVSVDDAVAPYDFEVTETGQPVRVDVKATDGGFERRIHISYGELLAMAEPIARYDLYRVYDMEDERASLRVARDLRGFAQAVLANFQGLAAGVSVDGISVDPRTLPFALAVIPLTLAVEED